MYIHLALRRVRYLICLIHSSKGDSRVFRFLNDVEPHKYRLEKPRAYIEYLKLIEELKNEEPFTTFFELMKQKVGYDITEYRALELAFFKGTQFKINEPS
jgi:hypothetical protein